MSREGEKHRRAHRHPEQDTNTHSSAAATLFLAQPSGCSRRQPPTRPHVGRRVDHAATTTSTHLPIHVDRLRVPADLRPAAPPIPPSTATATAGVQRAPADAHVSVLVVDGVAVAGGHGHSWVRTLCAVCPGPKVVSVRGLRLLVDNPSGGVAELVQQRLQVCCVSRVCRGQWRRSFGGDWCREQG